jgi:hypothetical protein
MPNYTVRQLNVWQLQDDKKVLKAAAKAAHKVLKDYYEKSIATYHSSVTTICDSRYKLQYFEFLYEAQGGANAIAVKKAKSHFEHVFSNYNRRAIGIKEYERQQAENVAFKHGQKRTKMESKTVDRAME